MASDGTKHQVKQVLDPAYSAKTCPCFNGLQPGEQVRYDTHGMEEIVLPGQNKKAYVCLRCSTEYQPLDPPPPKRAAAPDSEVLKEMEERMLEQGGEEFLREYQELNQKNPEKTDS